jgi:phospholipase C
MSKCTRGVDQAVIGCKAGADEQTARCSQWADEGYSKCDTWADEGYSKCDAWADEGYSKCDTWADEGSNQCCTWWPCSWACKAYYWVANWVCKASYWLADWVCKASYWLADWVCKASYWLANLVCKAWFAIVKAACTVGGWIAKTGCVIQNSIRCAVNGMMLAPLRRVQTASPISKVFVLMLENRSFDHMLGFAALQGTDAKTGLPTTANDFAPPKDLTQAPYTSGDPGGGTAEVSNDAPFSIVKEKKDPGHEDPGHEFKDVLFQLTGRQKQYWDDQSTTNVYPVPDNTGFIASYREHGYIHPKNIMQCFEAKNLPVLTALAREFAVCDNWFSSMPGPTWPNRFFLHAASSGGLDDSPDGTDTAVHQLIDGYRFANGTLFDLLDNNCIDWRIFEGDEFPQVFAISGMDLNALEGRYTDFDEFAADIAKSDFKPAYVFIEPNYGNILPTTDQDFTCGTSQHPLDDVTRGERLIKQVYEAIRNSPYWEASALVIVYDEHGGFFDHVSPPSAAAPGDPISTSSNNHHNFDFRQLGVRVPTVVVSPLIPRGTIDHTLYDHTSVARTMELLFGLKPLTARDAAAEDFLHLFSLSQARGDTPVTLPEPAESGFTCTTGPLTDLTDATDALESADAPGTSGLGAALAGAPAEGSRSQVSSMSSSKDRVTPRPVPSSFWGFMRVALRRWLLTIPPGQSERHQVVKQYLAVRSEEDARRFIHEARLRVRRYHGREDEFRPLIMRRRKNENERRSDGGTPTGPRRE